ncbi:MAG: diacylglycerol kinase, partial [Synergistaceae bacterium]|nr:diacylglycerol kinase [Synergistaceae bacterium]
MSSVIIGMKYFNPVVDRLYHGARYSLSGLTRALREEQAFRYEAVVLVVLFVVVPLAGLSLLSSVALIGAWLAVMALELVNSAVERAFDLIGRDFIDRDFNPDIKTGKDMLSAAVFLAILFNIALWSV